MVVPGYVPFALLLGLEAVAVLALARQPANPGRELMLCSHCAHLHERTETFARFADALAVGALAFLVALPYVAAEYESGFSLGGTILACSAVVAVLAIAAELDILARALASRLWPRLHWSVEPARILGGGARWLGALFALYLFQPGPGIAGLFGGVGKRVVDDLDSPWTIYAATAILVLAAAGAVLTRWLIPLLFHSLPTTLAVRHEARGDSA
ncbi:MAG: hypothetical protein JO140_02515 [Candidatus Eremiobacteraeota bacterium]|nr:hypothetical protein [Candidatus Eremiobacteraeota bacterium]